MLIFRDAELRSRILKVALPAMAEMLLYTIIGLVDIAFVGRLGAAPLAAVGLGAEIFFSVVFFLEALGIGAAILVAQSKGAGNREDADRITGYTYFIGLLMGLLAGYLGLRYSPAILGFFPLEAEVSAYVIGYLNITFLVAPLAVMVYMSGTVFRGLGRTDIPMKIALLANVVNIFGDYVLVFGKWGFPQMGVAGAALATSIAHMVVFVVISYLLFSGRTEIRIRGRLLWPVRWNYVKEIFVLGLPNLAEQFFYTSANLISIFLLIYLGTLAFASHEVALTVEMVSYMPGFGIAVAVTSLVGQAVGAGNKQEMLRVSRGSTEMALILMGMIGLAFALFPGAIARIFTNDADVIGIAATIIRIAALEQLTIALNMVAAGILKGTGDTRTPLYISAAFTWLFRIPLLYLFIRVWSLDIRMVWYMFITDWFLRAILYVIILQRGKWKDAKRRQIGTEPI